MCVCMQGDCNWQVNHNNIQLLGLGDELRCVCMQGDNNSPVVIIIKVFLKRKILSLETILSPYTHSLSQTHTLTHSLTHTLTHTQSLTQTHTHTGTCTHKHSDYTKLNIHSLKKPRWATTYQPAGWVAGFVGCAEMCVYAR